MATLKYTYEEMLDRAYKKLPTITKKSTRFEVPSVTGSLQGNKTLVTNLLQISNKLGRDINHLTRFLNRELATTSTTKNGVITFVGKFNSKVLNEKINKYIKEFVTCSQCGKPDTQIIKEKGVTFKRCEACGAKSTVRSIK